MKFNIEIEVEDIYEEDNLDIIFKEQIKDGIAKKVADIIAKNDFNSFIKDEFLNDVKKEYENIIEDLKKEKSQSLKKIDDIINSQFTDFINGVAYKTNSWGEASKETTVGELIREKISDNFKNLNTTLENLISKVCKEKLSVYDYQIKEIIENEKKKVLDENAKKVAEFIIKGIR